MGQSSSVPVSSRRKPFRSSWRSRFPPRPRTSKGNLSATFNILDTDTKIDQLNVNIACEEELMTLPSISRADAHNIVEYRLRIGRFKKVEDLALVSGIGADKLALIRPEICVGLRRSTSCASSRAQSFDSLTGSENKTYPRQVPLVNVNTATVFDLQAIPGFTQEIAANVIDYRDNHGNFIKLDQLTKVRGFNHMRLGAVRSRITVNSEETSHPIRNGCAPVLSIVHSTPKSSPKLPPHQPNANGKISGHRKSMSVPIKFGTVSNGLAVRDILDVLSVCSPRPIIEDYFDGMRRGQPAVRIASWNLSGLSLEKAENPGVREVICQTILENRFALVAVQDVIDSDALEKICSELNYPTLRRTKEWKENSHKWTHQTHKRLGFLWDANESIVLSEINVPKHQMLDDLSEVICGNFMIGPLPVSVFNLFFAISGTCEVKSNILDALQKQMNCKTNQIIVGDFFLSESSEDLSKTVGCEFKPAVPLKTNTNSNGVNHMNTIGPYTDNIYLNRPMHPQFTEMSGVIRQGLTHLAIPRNWSWGGPASEHCPVWCEIYVEMKSSLPD